MRFVDLGILQHVRVLHHQFSDLGHANHPSRFPNDLTDDFKGRNRSFIFINSWRGVFGQSTYGVERRCGHLIDSCCHTLGKWELRIGHSKNSSAQTENRSVKKTILRSRTTVNRSLGKRRSVRVAVRVFSSSFSHAFRRLTTLSLPKEVSGSAGTHTIQ